MSSVVAENNGSALRRRLIIVVVAAGVEMFGTLAAGEFLTNASFLEAALHDAPRDWQHKNMQAVIATKVIGGISGLPRVLATYFW